VIGQRNPDLLRLRADRDAVLARGPSSACSARPSSPRLQVIVYAGAIMVLFLFVLMLLNVQREEDAPGRGGRTLGAIAVALVALLVAQAGAVLMRAEPGPAPAFDASTRRMAEILFSPHFLYVFEATSDPEPGGAGGGDRARQEGPLDGSPVLRAPRRAAEPGAVRAGTLGVFLRRNVITVADEHRADAERCQPAFVAFSRAAGTLDGQVLVFLRDGGGGRRGGGRPRRS